MSAEGDPRRTVRILLADDHTLLREVIGEVLGLEPDFDVVGEAADGESAVELAAHRRPDVVLLDVEMPHSVPTETVRAIRRVSPHSRVIILTMHDAAQVVRDLVQCGVAGYLHKSIGRAALVAAIRGVVATGGGQRRLVMAVSHDALVSDGCSTLISPRERQVLVFVAAAFSNRQIATRLSITEATVKRHLRNVFEKLGAVSRIDAVNRAAAAGLIHVGAGGLRPGPGGHLPRQPDATSAWRASSAPTSETIAATTAAGSSFR